MYSGYWVIPTTGAAWFWCWTCAHQHLRHVRVVWVPGGYRQTNGTQWRLRKRQLACRGCSH